MRSSVGLHFEMRRLLWMLDWDVLSRKVLRSFVWVPFGHLGNLGLALRILHRLMVADGLKLFQRLMSGQSTLQRSTYLSACTSKQQVSVSAAHWSSLRRCLWLSGKIDRSNWRRQSHVSPRTSSDRLSMECKRSSDQLQTLSKVCMRRLTGPRCQTGVRSRLHMNPFLKRHRSKRTTLEVRHQTLLWTPQR